ncbi:sigma-70 family RNA polymerase sigma factor [Jiella marina]|uniref:sigma-70 family RNA polymerase sigma factor n=1 Tax=Jiella sp. LLJ827 TaxID=2917712 RepID=UPI0021019F7B|nr:sigma-70 family RNA polymerase sigma factor [Jiella sp. LLJ827]MCQ0988447.1 sigma-70 family RNA polymerase sigma factor [Jiella sp. LLJ827]
MQADQGRVALVAIMDRLAAGDESALGELYERTAAKLFGVTLRILHDREEAEDVLHDVYLTVWQRADRFDAGRASPITWLATIARNRSIDRLRRIGRRGDDQPVEAATGVADEAPDAFAALAHSEDGQRLAACLTELDEGTRGAIVAAFYGGITYEELARRLSVPLGTMKSRIRRGLIRLKGCLSR